MNIGVVSIGRRTSSLNKRIVFILMLIAVCPLPGWTQASSEFMEMSAPLPKTRVVVVRYINSFDGTPGEALLELPASLDHPVPLVLTSNPAGWTQEMNRCLWTGIADQLNVMILYPRGQDRTAPNASLGAPQQIANLESALLATEKAYPVDHTRIYAAGLSQGALEALLIAGRNPGQFAGVLSINPIADFTAFYHDLMDGQPTAKVDPLHPAPTVSSHSAPSPTASLAQLIAQEIGGTPDTARAAYYQRSPIIYSAQLARVPLILYWATDDELILNGATHQGGVLAALIRSFHPSSFEEIPHQGGHGYPFFHSQTEPPHIKLYPHKVFMDSVKQMLAWHQTQTSEK